MTFPLNDKEDYLTQTQLNLVLDSYIRSGFSSWDFGMEIRNGRMTFSNLPIRKYRPLIFLFHPDYKTDINLVLFARELIAENPKTLKSVLNAIHQITPFNDGYYILADIVSGEYLETNEQLSEQLVDVLTNLETNNIGLYTTLHPSFDYIHKNKINFIKLPIIENIAQYNYFQLYNHNYPDLLLDIPHSIQDPELKIDIALSALISRCNVLFDSYIVPAVKTPMRQDIVDFLSAITGDLDPTLENLKTGISGNTIFFEPNLKVDYDGVFSSTGIFAEYESLYQYISNCLAIWQKSEHNKWVTQIFRLALDASDNIRDIAATIRHNYSMFCIIPAIQALYNGVPLDDIEY